MSTPIEDVEVTSEAIDKAAGLALLERRSRDLLGIGAEEFLEALDSGQIDQFDHVDVMELAMLVPLAR